jgi:hypothetical protein
LKKKNQKTLQIAPSAGLKRVELGQPEPAAFASGWRRASQIPNCNDRVFTASVTVGAKAA